MTAFQGMKTLTLSASPDSSSEITEDDETFKREDQRGRLSQGDICYP